MKKERVKEKKVKYLTGELSFEGDRSNTHFEWINQLIKQYGIENTNSEAMKIIENEIGEKFAGCLVDCGVFKQDEIGLNEFRKFITHLGFKHCNQI